MLDLTKAYRIYIDGKPVKSLSFGDTVPIWIDNSRLEFTLLNNFKVRAKKGELVEEYNLSYAASPKTPNYFSSISFKDEADGTYYYLTTVNTKDKGELQNEDTGEYFSSGWYSDINQDGGEYNMSIYHYTRNILNKWYFGYKIQNKSTAYPLDDNMLDEAIRRINCAFPRAHILRTTESSVNYFEMDDYEDTWLALCTSWTDHIRIQFNHDTLSSYYGIYTTDTTSNIYKKWLGTAVHELGHTFGPPDQATHYPSIYDYSRDRAKALYLQSNDIAWIKHAYCDKYGCSPDIFEAESDIAEKPRMMKAAARTIPTINDGGCVMNFDYYDSFDTPQDLENASTNIVIATLTYDKRDRLNIGGDLEIDYDIYNINVIDELKGSLTNKQLKVHLNEINIDENKTYKLYLKEYKKTPCSLINTKTSLIEI